MISPRKSREAKAEPRSPDHSIRIHIRRSRMTAALGISTTLVEARDQMLDFLDPEIIEALRYHMRDMRPPISCGRWTSKGILPWAMEPAVTP